MIRTLPERAGPRNYSRLRTRTSHRRRYTGSTCQHRFRRSLINLSPWAGGMRVRFRRALGKFPHVTGGGASRGDAMAAGIGKGDCRSSRSVSRPRIRLRRYQHCEISGVLDLDPLAPRTPRLPHQRWGAPQLAASIALHVSLVVVAVLIETTTAPGTESRQVGQATEAQVRHVVFLAPEVPRTGGGGGGGGNQQPGPIRRAQGVGSDSMTLRVRKGPSPTAAR
jgi:hypothetical protein